MQMEWWSTLDKVLGTILSVIFRFLPEPLVISPVVVIGVDS
jgi:hypothetical protein